MRTTDVLVIGGGPAGLATAIAARLKGLRVTVADPRIPPIDKPCGEGLLPEAVESLSRLGICLDSVRALPFAGIRFSDEHSSVSARFAPRTAFGMRRTVLHATLVARATELGVTLCWGARVSNLSFRGACIGGGFLPCSWIVGADGQHSTVREFAGLGKRRPGRFRLGFRRHYAVAPWTNLVEVYWDDKLQLIVTPISPREICLTLFSGDSQLRIDRALHRFPAVAARLPDLTPTSTEAGSITSLSRARAVARHNIALVGDASCTVDGIAGQGLSLAFQQALALADALAAGDLSVYATAHRRIRSMPVRMSRLLLLMNASVLLRSKILRVFAGHPALFSKMIFLHIGQPAPVSAATRELFGIGWRALRA
jgi:menaquinone-9 beta-reductase